MALAIQMRILTYDAAPLNMLYKNGDYRCGLSEMGQSAVAAIDSALNEHDWRLPTLEEVLAVQATLFSTTGNV
jgi:hypothetical protein